jgi:hypothetical protein
MVTYSGMPKPLLAVGSFSITRSNNSEITVMLVMVRTKNDDTTKKYKFAVKDKMPG